MAKLYFDEATGTMKEVVEASSEASPEQHAFLKGLSKAAHLAGFKGKRGKRPPGKYFTIEDMATALNCSVGAVHVLRARGKCKTLQDFCEEWARRNKLVKLVSE